MPRRLARRAASRRAVAWARPALPRLIMPPGAYSARNSRLRGCLQPTGAVLGAAQPGEVHVLLITSSTHGDWRLLPAVLAGPVLWRDCGHRDRDSEGQEKENVWSGGTIFRKHQVLSGRARQGERERERARGSEGRERRRATRAQNYHVSSNLVIKAVVFPTATAPTAPTVVVADFYKSHPRLPTARARRKADQQTRKHREGQKSPFVGTGVLYLSWRASIPSCSPTAEHGSKVAVYLATKCTYRSFSLPTWR